MGAPWLFRLARNCAATRASSRPNGKTEIAFRSVLMASRTCDARFGIASQSMLDFHLRDYRKGQSSRCFLTEPRSYGLFATHEVAQHIGVKEYFTKKHLHAVAAVRRDTIRTAACRERPATPRSRGPAGAAGCAIKFAPWPSVFATAPVVWQGGPSRFQDLTLTAARRARPMPEGPQICTQLVRRA